MRQLGLGRAIIVIGAVVLCGTIVSAGPASAETVRPTVTLTSQIRVDRNHSLEAVAFYGERQVVDHRFLSSAPSTDFRGERLTGLKLIRVDVSSPGHTMTTIWTVEFNGTAEHHDLTTENIVFDRLPSGVRLVSKETTCFNGNPAYKSCT